MPKKTILVLDDEKSIRTLFEEEFKDEGYDVVSTDSGEEALEMLDKGTPHIDLITLDIKMPKMDGLDFLSKVREKHRELPIIICTAYNNYRHEFSVWNADGYILKSGNLTEIKDKIKRLIG
ncbi:response regulator [Brachyspira hyodysenteriae]|uniref:response regulator n=1 Tax=Brachyspira hyodysenteriae TaxID=159 RepID=UPI00063DC3E4|nr:response regulator [Brachyspira hyodysenteriae]KLI20306.1 chemotaxis protein CheY [Brachyspira hyodysenteriae]